MAEVQRTTNSSDNAAQFIEFVMLQAQNASLFLGLIAHPENGRPEVNLPLARMFIDHLGMLQEKTRGNLSTEEAGVLRNALSNLQMAYVEVAQETGASLPAEPSTQAAAEHAPVSKVESQPPAQAAGAGPTAEPEDSRESKKRFTKSYGS